MATGVLSNRIYLPKEKELFTSTMEKLTYKIPSKRRNVAPEIYCDIKIVNPRVFSIPSGRMDLVPKNIEIKDKRVLVPTDLPHPRIELREDQKDIYGLIHDNCLINAKPGWGKTFSALWLSYKFGQKTLIVVHNTAMRDQWVLETEKLFGFKPGIIGSNKFQTDTPVVISNIQTLTKHIHKYGQTFGTIICDEVHRVPASTFKKIVDASYARYKFGLSATIKRKDGKHVYIPDYFSKDIYTPLTDTSLKPKIFCLHTDIALDHSLGHWVRKVTALCEREDYINLVKDIVDIKSNLDGHKVLAVGERLEFLEACHLLTPNSRLVTGAVTNRMDIFDEVLENKANSIYGIISIFKEGINIPPLSCLVLACPINNEPLLEQVIGRVTRPYPGKRQPEIWDIVFKDRISRSQFAQRVNYYTSKGYEIEEITVN